MLAARLVGAAAVALAAAGGAAPAAPSATELRSYRLSPRQWQFLRNSDTGDAGGDIFFGLWLRLLRPLAGGGGAFAVQAARWDSYGVHVADVNASFGEYRSCDAGCISADPPCTPWDSVDLSGGWSCEGCDEPADSCAAVGRTVYPSSPCRQPGSDDCLRSQLIDKFTPTWYSFQAQGRCPAGAAIGTNGCTWRERLLARRVVSASCVEEKLAALAQQALPRCFAGCGDPAPPLNYTSAR